MTEPTHFQIHSEENYWLLRITASRLDARIANLIKPELQQTLQNSRHKPVLMDLSAVNFMDSTGLGTVVLGKKLVGKEGDFRVVGTSGEVALLFELTHMNRILDLYADLSSATADLS